MDESIERRDERDKFSCVESAEEMPKILWVFTPA